MSNTVNLDDYEKLNFLFKNYLGFPNTDKTKPFFLETAVKANNYLFGGEIFLDTIPLTPDFDSGNGTNHNANSLNIDSNKLNASGSAIHTDSSNVVRRFTKIKLEKISGTQRGYYCLDQNNNNILKDALQFNVNKADDGTQPYLYKLYTNSGVDSDEQILPNAAGGNWIFDVKNGVVNFPDTITGYTVNESSPPYLTFYKYVGRKGLNQLSTTDIVGLGTQTQNIQLQITELSGNILDISQNIYRKDYIDASFNDVYTKATIDSKLTTLEGEIDASFNDVYTKAIIDSKLTTLEGEIDASFNDVYTKAVIDSKLTTLEGEIDASFNDVYTKAVIDSKLTTLEGEIDASFNDVYTKAVIDSKLTTLESEIDASFNDVYTKATIDSKLTTLESEIDVSFNDVYTKAVIDGKLTTLESEIDASFNDVYTKATIDSKLTTLEGEIDASFNDVYTKAVIDGKLTTLESEIDASFNDVYTKSFIDNKFTNINQKADDISQNVLNLDATLRSYVDGLVSGLDVKHSVKAATIDASNVNLNSIYTISNPLIIDGITINDQDRILLKNQTNKRENGIYDLSGNSLVRSSDFNTSDNISYGAFTFVELGNINNDKGFILTKGTNSPDVVTVNDTELDFSQFSGAGQIVAGNGLAKNGEVISVNVDGSTINITNDILHIHNDFIRRIDNSFNNVYIKSEINNRFTNLETEIDASFNDVYTKAVIESKFTILESEIDNSLNIIKTSIDVLEEGVTSSWILGANGSSSYTFDGPGLNPNTENPTIYLTRGQKYKFKNRTGGHPFRIQSDENGTSYNSGVTNNSGGNNKDIVFEVPMDAPSKLWYQCTAHPLMLGVIYIGDKIFDLSSNHAALVSTVSDLSSNVYSKTYIDVSLNTIKNTISIIENESNFTSSWILGSIGSNSYTFDGPGLNSNKENPTIYLTRGQKYKFKNRTGGHPFRIQSDENGTSYDSGVTNNSGGNNKDIIFEVPMDAPSKLWYQCTAHPLMLGVIYIGDKIFDLSSNHAALVSTVSDLSSNHATLVSTVSDLSSNHATLVSTVSDLSNNVYSKTEIDTSFNQVNQTITNLSNNVYLKTEIDTSFNNINQTITNLSNNVYSKTDIDTSFNEVNQKIINLELDDLSNVDTNSVQNDQYLKYDSLTQRWGPSSITTDNIQGGSGNSDVVNNRNQTFFELLTQQPNQFTASSTTSSSSQITINWNYNDIVPTHEVGVFAKLMFPSASADRSLPHIDEIRFDISGVNTKNSNFSQVWVNDSGSTISLNSSNDYNSGSTYKSKIFPKTALSNANNSQVENILSKTSPIDIRVYGVVNNGIDFPSVNSRALVFRGLQFSEAAAPSQPIRQPGESISATSNSFTVNYIVSQTENGVNGSSARINSITGKYTELTGTDTLVSTIITQTDAGIEQTKTTSLNLLNAGQNLPITFDNLRFGTKYTYKVSVKNNFSSTSSADSAQNKMSNFTRIPQAGSNNLNLNIHTNSLKNILKPSSSLLSNIVYVNISETTTGLKFANTNLQTFEVTDTSASTSFTSGIGKGVDDEDDIALIEISKNVNGGTYTSLQLIKYSGFDTTTNTVKSFSKSTNNIITNVNTNDKYSSDALRKGFRIEGKFQLNNIASSDITSLIGGASSNPYGIRLNYTSTYNTGSNLTNTKEVYIDNLGSDPSITKTSGETFNITDQLYTMGIPSVKEFSATFNRTYNNICSQYGFIPGDGKIGEITSIAGTNKSSATLVTITSSEIPTSTPFNKTKQTTISNVFYNTGTLLTSNQSLVVREKAFSLKKPDGIPSDGGSDTITTSHFCDRNSYNLSSNKINSRKFQTSFYEITDATQLGRLNTNIGSIGVTKYSDTTHKTQIQPWTLLFIDGKLQTNAAKSYPDFSSSNFDQNGINSADQSTYSYGTSSYDLTGSSTGVNNNGYKWIVFKIPKNNDSTGYKFAKTLGSTVESNITIKTNSSGFPYISLKDLFGNFFTSTTLEKLVDQSDVEVIGFCRANTGGNSNKTLKLGSLKKSYAPNTNWTSSGTSNIGYSSISNSNGCSVENGSDYGLYVNITSMDDDLEIFIGLKNNANL